MSKTVVTGGAGFIGSHVVDALVARGDEVHVIDDLSSGKKANLPEGATLHELDIRDDSIQSLIAKVKPETIVHAAAQISVRRSMEDPVFDSDVNVRGLVNVLQAAALLEEKPHMVFTSTGGAIYGDQEVYPATEDHPIKPTSVYGLAKRVGELYLEFWSRELGITFSALRFANVYGPRQDPHGEAGVVAIFSQMLLADKQPRINGTGEQTRDFVFVKDVARAICEVCSKRVDGIFNIGTGKETSVNELYELIRGAAGSSLAADSGPAMPGEQMRSCIDAKFAGEAFGWKPEISIEDGIKETVAWFSEQPA